MVARRAHNPEVVRFKSHLRNQRKKDTIRCPFCVGCGNEICASRPSGYSDERSSLGIAPCRCRWQKKAGRNFRSGRILRQALRRRTKFGNRKAGYVRTCFWEKCFKSHHKISHNRYNFGYGILLYIRKRLIFALLPLISAALRAFFLVLTKNPPSSTPARQEWRILYRLRVQSFKE